MRRISVLTLVVGVMAVTAQAQAQILQRPNIPKTPTPPAPPPTVPYVPSPSAKPIITIPHIETPSNLGQPQPQPKPQYKYTPLPYTPPLYISPSTHTAPQLPEPKPFSDWLKDAEGGDLSAELHVAEAYLNGRWVDDLSAIPPDETGGAKAAAKALDWYTKAANAGSVQAMTTLGSLYENGESYQIKPDAAVAFGWYKKSADQDASPDTLARAKVCKAYITGHGTAVDVKAALPYCNVGDVTAPIPTARFEVWAMAHAYETGIGRPLDMAKARQLYAMAVAEGIPEAMVDLGRLAEGEKDYAAAFVWYKKAAATHALAAARPLAMMYENGWCTEPDLMMAAWLYRLSAKWGDAEAVAWVSGHPVSDLEKEINRPLILSDLAPPGATATFVDTQGQSQTVAFGSQYNLMAQYYPERALDTEQNGRVQFACRLDADHRLSLCFVEGEYPEGYGFARATLRVFFNHEWVFQAKDRAGKDTQGRILRQVFRWSTN